jgi:hypothetical protein
MHNHRVGWYIGDARHLHSGYASFKPQPAVLTDTYVVDVMAARLGHYCFFLNPLQFVNY